MMTTPNRVLHHPFDIVSHPQHFPRRGAYTPPPWAPCTELIKVISPGRTAMAFHSSPSTAARPSAPQSAMDPFARASYEEATRQQRSAVPNARTPTIKIPWTRLQAAKCLRSPAYPTVRVAVAPSCPTRPNHRICSIDSPPTPGGEPEHARHAVALDSPTSSRGVSAVHDSTPHRRSDLSTFPRLPPRRSPLSGP